MESEFRYGTSLGSTITIRPNGFGADDGATLKRAFEGITSEMVSEGDFHIQLSNNIKTMIIEPFNQWSKDHRDRVDFSNTKLKVSLKNYEKVVSETEKTRNKYFNKCRIFEEEKNKFEDPEAELNSSNLQSESNNNNEKSPQPSEKSDAIQDEDDYNKDIVTIGSIEFDKKHRKGLFEAMLNEIPQADFKVPILGTYNNVSTGSEIVDWLQHKLGIQKVRSAEVFGQDLVTLGYIRLVGQVGSTFGNSSILHYQWKPQSFFEAGLTKSEATNGSTGGTVGDYLGEMIGISNTANLNETPLQKHARELKALEQKYETDVINLDDLRCTLEETIIDHLSFMEKCELDRLKALKKTTLDFSAAISNKIQSLSSVVEKLILYQETINPLNDLNFLLDNYKTGSYTPKVILYDNYYKSSDSQVFGVDLEARCRVDNKKVPLIISGILSYMDSIYPIMENDEIRQLIWITQVKLKSTHELRKKLNIPGPIMKREILSDCEPSVIASVLKLYLLELPESVIPSNLYDVFKSIYKQYGNNSIVSSGDNNSTNNEFDQISLRLSAIQNTLSGLSKCNIATLDVITRHFARLISIINTPSDDNTKVSSPTSSIKPPHLDFKTRISQELSGCILRPKVQSNLTLGDRHVSRLISDLITYRDTIFKALKRQNSSSRSSSLRNPSSSQVRSGSRSGSSMLGKGLHGRSAPPPNLPNIDTKLPSPVPVQLYDTNVNNKNNSGEDVSSSPVSLNRRSSITSQPLPKARYKPLKSVSGIQDLDSINSEAKSAAAENSGAKKLGSPIDT